MANKIPTAFEAGVTLAITTAPAGAGLANGAGRVSDKVDVAGVSRAPGGRIFVQIKSGASAPTANAVVKVYFHAHSSMGTSLIDGGVGAVDAALSTEPTDAKQLGEIVFPATANLVKTKSFDLDFILPAGFSISLWNALGQALSTTSADTIIQFTPFTPEIQ